MTHKILIDFVGGTHGHFLEFVLNKYFHEVEANFSPFKAEGTSHKVTREYEINRVFHAEHWFENEPSKFKEVDKIISIGFSHDDLLLAQSISLNRANEIIDIDQLEIDTFNKLNTKKYRSIFDEIVLAYPFLKVDAQTSSIPRNILREFFKFGFANPDNHGMWRKRQLMIYPNTVKVFTFEFSWFYDREKFINGIKQIEKFLDKKFDFCDELYELHDKFLSFIQYKNHKIQCDSIIKSITCGEFVDIPKITLFQESYINAKLEKIYCKEMPFHQQNYFTSTKDVLKYIKSEAPDL